MIVLIGNGTPAVGVRVGKTDMFVRNYLINIRGIPGEFRDGLYRVLDNKRTVHDSHGSCIRLAVHRIGDWRDDLEIHELFRV